MQSNTAATSTIIFVMCTSRIYFQYIGAGRVIMVSDPEKDNNQDVGEQLPNIYIHYPIISVQNSLNLKCFKLEAFHSQ